jgi:hypothetical protein
MLLSTFLPDNSSASLSELDISIESDELTEIDENTSENFLINPGKRFRLIDETLR